MDRLRPRNREMFSGFTKFEQIEKMEKLLDKPEESFSKEFCVKLAKGFNRSSGRAGKPVVKWQEVQNWLHKRRQEHPNVASSPKVCKNVNVPASPRKIAHDNTRLAKGEKIPDLSEIEFEAKSAKDGAWYDVEMFLAHRYVDSGEVEVLVRFVGFGAEEDEWINVKNAVRERSVPLESSECHRVKVGDILLCFQERRDRAIHYDAQVLEIERRMHDIRGCRCLFLIQYKHDNSKERVRLRRLCSRPTW